MKVRGFGGGNACLGIMGLGPTELHMLPQLASASFNAGCFPHLGAGLGAGLGTVDATSRNDHFPCYHNLLVPSINDPLPQAQLHCIVVEPSLGDNPFQRGGEPSFLTGGGRGWTRGPGEGGLE